MKNTLKFVDKDYDVTSDIQNLIDSLNVNETLKFNKGVYNIRNIFLKSNINIIFEEGCILNEIVEGENFKIIDTRVAGINMKFYAGLVNLIDVKNVSIKGKAIICGNGEYWWEKYWGKDQKGGMRYEYDKENIRFLCDYDCLRVRNLLIQNSSNIKIADITSKDSGFWNIHILYSHDVVLDNVVIDSKALWAPSTDGIDIDSSYNVVVKNSTTYTNDDSICIKSGRDKDGLDTAIPSHDILIENCTINQGFGITLGSELSGGIYNVKINNIKFRNTDCGFRIKSSEKRKGYIKNIEVSNLDLVNVMYPIHIALNWNPNYSNTTLPKSFNREMKEHYYKLISDVGNLKNTQIENITISNLNSIIDNNMKVSRAFEINGFSDSHIKDFTISNSNFTSFEFGRISNVDNLKFLNTTVSILKENDNKNDEYDNR